MFRKTFPEQGTTQATSLENHDGESGESVLCKAILRRIQGKRSNYDVVQWEEERFKREKLIKNITEFHTSMFGNQHGYEQYRRVTSHSPQRNELPKIGGKSQ